MISVHRLIRRLDGSLVRGASVAVLAILVAACGNGGDEHLYVDAGADAGPQKPKDSKLAAAIAAAEASAKANGPATAAEDPNGPPSSGVFAPGKADSIQAVKAPPKVEVISDGAEPRVTLSNELKEEQKLSITLGLRIGQQLVPNIDFDLVAKPDKKDDKAKDKPKDKGKDKDKDKEKDKAAGSPVFVKITGATAAKDQQVQLPKEVGEKLGKLKGCELRYTLTPEGAMRDLEVAATKEVEGLDMVLHALAEALSVATTPAPPKPVGVGGYWMVTDRTMSFGVDLVRYRVFKIEKLDGQTPTLSIDIREYAAKDDLDLGGNSPKLFIGRLDGQGKGKETFASALPKSLEIDERLQMLIGQAKGQPSQPLMFQLTVKAR